MGCLKNPITKFIFKILFSHMGLCFLACGYIVGGAYLFQWIEADGEKERYRVMQSWARNISYHREALITEVIQFLRGSNQTEMGNETVGYIYGMLDDYQLHIKLARNETYAWGRQAYKGLDEPPEKLGWEITSAILFTSTIMTTVGFGHIAPVTETGYMVCIIYSVFAIPLLSMFVMNITEFLSDGIRLLYHKGICCALERRRNKEHLAAHIATSTIYDFESNKQRVAPIQSGDPRNAWEPVPSKTNVGIPSLKSARRRCITSRLRERRSVDRKQTLLEKEEEEHHVQEELNKLKPEHLIPASLAITFWVGYLIGGAVLFYQTEDNWTMVASFYFVITTLLTIGFGDIVPGVNQSGTQKGQMQFGIVSIYIVVGLAMTGAVTRLGFDAAKEHMGKGKRLLAEKAEALKQSRKKLNRDDLYDRDDSIDHLSMIPYTHK